MADPVVNKDTPAAPGATAAPDTAPTVSTPVAPTDTNTTTVPPLSGDAATPAAAPAAPAAAAPPASTTPLQDLYLASTQHAHKEIWGVTLSDPATHVPTQIVLQKYLNANDGDLGKAKDQLVKTLDWRAKVKPLDLLEKSFSRTKFAGLGYVTVHGGGAAAEDGDGGDKALDPRYREVFTWNIYGAVKDMNETFGVLDEFIEWRVTLMELAVHRLNLSSATEPITATSDPYKIYQVHDYQTISFFRPPPKVKNASTETIKVLALAYPELLKEKFFVNVPALMGFMYGLMKLFVAAKTIKKFHPMSNGGGLALEFGDSRVQGLGELLPKVYGGKGEDLAAQGEETKLA